MGEHAPGVIKMLADVATGGSTKELFKQMEAGKLDPNVLLPKLAAEMEKKSAQGEARWRGSSAFQQGLAEKRLEDQLKMFAGSGGNAGFLKIWTTFADTLPKMAPLFRAAGQGFDFFAQRFKGLGTIVAGLSEIVGGLQNINYFSKEAGETILHLSPFIAAAWKRAFAPLYAGYLILEDMATYAMGGGKSVTGAAMQAMGFKNNTKEGNVAEIKNVSGLVMGTAKPSTFNPTGTILGEQRYRTKLELQSKYSAATELKLGGLAVADWVLGNQLFIPRTMMKGIDWALGSNDVRLTAQDQVNLMNNQGFTNVMGQKGGNVFNLTFNTDTNDPQEMANLVTKAITTSTIPYMIRNNGE